MHVLIIPSEIYATPFYPLGGIFQNQQVHALKRAGIKVGILSVGFRSFYDVFKIKKDYQTFENDNGVPTYRSYKKKYLPSQLYPHNLLINSQINLGLSIFAEYIKEQGIPDIIHAHNCFYAGVIALSVKENYSIPFIITEHSDIYASGAIPTWKMSLAEKVYMNAAIRSVVSSKLGDLLKGKFKSIEDWLTIYNILDRNFEQNLINNQNSSDLFTFLSIGSLDTNKNHAILLSAFAKQFKGKENFQLRIGGKGHLRKELVKLSAKLGIEKQVHFLGLLNRSEVLSEMNHCNVFLLSSNYETFGVVLIEALACGKPVIATACGGPQDIVNENNGILIPINDMNALQNSMVYMYSNYEKYDKNLIKDDCIKRFGEKSFVDNLLKIYNSVLLRV